jgi:hypothetical protein
MPKDVPTPPLVLERQIKVEPASPWPWCRSLTVTLPEVTATNEAVVKDALKQLQAAVEERGRTWRFFFLSVASVVGVIAGYHARADLRAVLTPEARFADRVVAQVQHNDAEVLKSRAQLLDTCTKSLERVVKEMNQRAAAAAKADTSASAAKTGEAQKLAETASLKTQGELLREVRDDCAFVDVR